MALLRRLKQVPFLYDSKEGDGDDDSRIQELGSYLALHVRFVEDLRAKVKRSPRLKSALKKCNKGGGSRRRSFLERIAAVVQVFSQREQEESEGARANKASTRLERSTPAVLYPKQYVADVARLQIELGAEDRRVMKPSRCEKLVAACANNFERVDMAVAFVEPTVAQHQDTRRAARHRKNASKAALAAQMLNYAFQNCAADPLSDEKRS